MGEDEGLANGGVGFRLGRKNCKTEEVIVGIEVGEL